MEPQSPTAPLVIASNRGPVDFRLTSDGSVVSQRGEGGLIAVLGPVLAGGEGIWVAAARTEGDRLMARRADAGETLVSVDLPEGRVALRGLELEPQTYEGYYSSVSTQTLWFLHHHLLDQPLSWHQDGLRADWRAYERVNHRFALACAETAASEALVLVQDYHLSMVPALLRERRPDLRIAHFTMCPWADPNWFQLLPEEAARSLIEGMLGADVVAFLAQQWADNFLGCCRELGFDVEPRTGRIRRQGGSTLARVYPVGVDVGALRARLDSAQVRAEARLLEDVIGDRQVVARVERMEPAKNTVRGIAAFEDFLAANPEYTGRVVHYVLAYSSRAGLPNYQMYAAEVQATARAVNERFGTPGWTPVLLDTANNFDRGLALMARADVLVVNSVRDGMNLVVKETAAVNDRDAVVVLSRATGAAEELGNATVLVDPLDTTELSSSISTAVAMPRRERRQRLMSLRRSAGALPPKQWLAAVVSDLPPSTLAPASGREGGTGASGGNVYGMADQPFIRDRGQHGAR